jgi:hypothetical protein
MRTLRRIVAVIAAAGILFGCRAKDEEILFSTRQLKSLLSGRTWGATRLFLTQTADKQGALQIDFGGGEKSQAEFPVPADKADWQPFGALVVRVSNPSATPIGFSIEVMDAAGARTQGQTQWDLGPHQSQRVALPLNSPWPVDMGMRGEPLIPGVQMLSEDHRRIDLTQVASIRIAPQDPDRPRSLLVKDIRLMPGVSYDRIVDAFGQFALENWPGKLTKAGDLESQRANEEAELLAHPKLADRDEYGGWASGPQLAATGYFRTERYKDRWWLVTPNGHLFFSLGMNVVSARGGQTVVEGREHLFRWLPMVGDPLARYYGAGYEAPPLGLSIKYVQGRTFDFYAANLQRKYGPDWPQRWRSSAVTRLRSWGFNTIGNWSDPKLYKEDLLPYTATLQIHDAGAVIPGAGAYWSRMLDPFDPTFTEAVNESVRVDTGCSHDPWCIGYFVDNELPWGSLKDERSHYTLALGTLSLGNGSPAKRELLHQLQARYGDIQSLNEAWALHISSWQALLDEPISIDRFTDPMRIDMTSFLRSLAVRYFQTVHDALRKYDPAHLYLGSRFYNYTPESAEACAEFCDVLSFNIYELTLKPAEWSFLDTLGRPAIVGEFHMGATDRGMFHPGLVSTPNQAARAAAFISYVRSVFANPAFVGCHYFQYNDEPVTGRSMDGENYGIGFTSVVDSPYPEMVKSARIIGNELYERAW